MNRKTRLYSMFGLLVILSIIVLFSVTYYTFGSPINTTPQGDCKFIWECPEGYDPLYISGEGCAFCSTTPVNLSFNLTTNTTTQ